MEWLLDMVPEGEDVEMFGEISGRWEGRSGNDRLCGV